MAAKTPAVRSATGMPTRIGPRPGSPVIDIKPAHPLRDLVESRTVAVRPVLPKAGDAGINDPRIDRLQALVIHPEAELHVRPVVLHHHISLSDEALHHRQPVRRLQVQGQTALVAVQVLKVRTMPLSAQTRIAVG